MGRVRDNCEISQTDVNTRAKLRIIVAPGSLSAVISLINVRTSDAPLFSRARTGLRVTLRVCSDFDNE